MTAEPLVLGIETSCDETGIGIVRGTTLLADEVASSVEEHARFGGVVPEVASRAHLEAMLPTMDRALRAAGVSLSDVDAIAVTAGPGLAGALLVGVAAAKGYAIAADKPVYGVNHLAAHVAVDTLEHGDLPERSIALLVSGGHSSLLLVEDLARGVVPLGATIDDAAGEAYDKVARLLGMPFPGGPPIDRAARDGDREAIAFPRGLTGPRDHAEHRFNFSFSGLRRPSRGGSRRASGPASRSRWPTSRRASRRPCATSSWPRPWTPAAPTTPTRSSSVAAWRPTHGSGRWPNSGVTGPASRYGSRDRSCAPTTAPWWRRSAPIWSLPVSRPVRSTCPPTRPCPSLQFRCEFPLCGRQ